MQCRAKLEPEELLEAKTSPVKVNEYLEEADAKMLWSVWTEIAAGADGIYASADNHKLKQTKPYPMQSSGLFPLMEREEGGAEQKAVESD